MSKRNSLILLVVLVLVSFVVSYNKTKSEKPVIKIGVTLPLTGDVASVGIASQTAMNMALDKWKTKNTKYDYQLVFEDNKLMPSKIATNTNRLISVEKVDAVASIWGFVDVIKGIIQDREIINFACSWGTSASEGEYNFNHSTPPLLKLQL